MARDEFSEKVKRDLSDRVQGYCSNPNCGGPTKGPHSDDDKVDNVGTASHIHAASLGGPRYNPTQTPEERRSHGNGIWLCRTCGTLVDNDEVRYPADLLRSWKRDAEARARLRLEAHAAETLLECGAAATAELLRWPTSLPDGTWIERPELGQLLSMVRNDDVRPIVLLGVPGSGKSALLARFSGVLRAEGVHVIAIKADRLPSTIGTARDLRDHLGFPLPVASAICTIAHSGLTVLVIDQLDALSDLLDVKTERLSVLLSLIESVVGADNVRVVCSARAFDFRHDVRFERLSAQELALELPDIAVVDRALEAAGHDPKAAPDALRQLLRTPQWLKEFLGLRLSSRDVLPRTWHALLERVWQRKVVSPPYAVECEATLRAIAKEIANREELWIPRAVLPHSTSLDRLVSLGLLLLDEGGHRIAFAHQLLYEFARARTFLSDESLVAYLRGSQNSLFVRPTLWTALGYLRTADPGRYAADLAALWSETLRRHVRLLLVEFMGQQEQPDDHEAGLLLPLLEDTSWQLAAFSAVAGSRGWFDRLQRGYLKGAMTGRSPGLALHVLVAGARIAPQVTVSLLRENWASHERFAGHTLQVLYHLEQWDDEAFAIANNALAASSDGHALDGLVWHLKKHRPEFAIRLIAASLESELTHVLQTVAPSTPLGAEATDEQRIRWHMHREPRDSLGALLSSISSKHTSLCELAELNPRVLLDNMLPWLSRLLAHAVDADPSEGCYVDDYLLGSKPVEDLPRELADALRVAAQRLAAQDAVSFFAVVDRWKVSELISIHVALNFGLEVATDTSSRAVLDYLLEDRRRLCIGDSQGCNRCTVSLLSRLAGKLDARDIEGLEAAILRSEPYAVEVDRPVESRRRAQRHNRIHRLALLSTLPESMLSREARSVIDLDGRALGNETNCAWSSHGFREIRSPMSAQKMARARDDDIINLFGELVDTTQWDHPRRWMQGGSIQASREFGSFAKQTPDRAVTISQRFQPGRQEGPAGEMLRGLAETALPTSQLETLVADFDKRGFASEDFRTDAAWALEKRASALSDVTLRMLVDWIPAAVRESAAPPREERGKPPFLWGFGGGGVLPRGSYPMLSAVTVALLSRTPPGATRWLEILEEHLPRRDAFDVWHASCHYLRWLRAADPTRAATFLNNLFAMYPDVLESAHGVQLLAHASWWLPPDLLCDMVLRLREGSWEHGKRAFGELVGFLGVREPAIERARSELADVLEGRVDESARLGVAGVCVDLWDSSWRDRCTDVLERIASDGGRAEREQILDGLHSSRLMVDDASRRVLVALAADPEAFLTTRSGLAMEWVSGLVHCYPSEVLNLVERLLQVLEARGADAPPVYSWSEALVNLSVTMQRLPRFRGAGLDVFERLLAMGFYGARRALDEADAWPRFRRTL